MVFCHQLVLWQNARDKGCACRCSKNPSFYFAAVAPGIALGAEPAERLARGDADFAAGWETALRGVPFLAADRTGGGRSKDPPLPPPWLAA